MASIAICLIGGGPRALITLNALRRHILKQHYADLRFVITIVDPNPGGTGCHDPHQPGYLYTNTLASQLTAFHPGVPDGEEAGWMTGPSFTEWARMAGVVRRDERFDQDADHAAHPVSELDYLPRSLLGQYLAWAFRSIARAFPTSVTLLNCHAMATDIHKGTAGGYRISLSNRNVLEADFVFLSTGHSKNAPDASVRGLRAFVDEAERHNPLLACFPHCYPLANLEAISPRAQVAVQGLGLTAWDAIAELTEGRGGRYGNVDGRTVYFPSGHEPRILLFSRRCLPYAARGSNQKGLTSRHDARIFTPAKVEALRETKLADTGRTQLDFESDVLPMLLAEMAYAHRTARLGYPICSESIEPSPEELRAIGAEFDPFGGKRFSSLAEFRLAFLGQVRRDLAEADRGNLTSPIKAATDVIRDCRAAICAAVEHRGLTPRSERWFREQMVPDMNRIAFGPPKFRNHQMLALFEAGIVDLAAGPNNRLTLDRNRWRFVIETDFTGQRAHVAADVLIQARLDVFRPESDDNLISAALLRRGLARPLRNGDHAPGGYDVTRDLRPIGADGTPTNDLWIMGYPTEGAIFYTHAIPRAGLASTQHAMADACVSRMFVRMGCLHKAEASFPEGLAS